MLRRIASNPSSRRQLLGATTLTAASTYAYVKSDDTTLVGIQRQTQFWTRMTPIVFDYYWHFSKSSPYVKYQAWRYEDRDEDEAKRLRKLELDACHEKHAPAMLGIMLDLKGLYVKLGQVLSVTALPIPEAYRARFRTLQSDVPGWEEFETIRKVLEREFDRPLDELFSEFSHVPAGAASIGQAHKARLRETGEDVIVKVQYPDAAWQVPADIRCVGDFLTLCVWAGVVDEASARLSYEEFARQFTAELDYDAERENLQAISDSSRWPGSPYAKWGVVVPQVFEDLCTPRVITMDYLPGPKLEEEARRQLLALGIDTTKANMRDMIKDVAKSAEDPSQTDETVVVPPAAKSGRVRLAERFGRFVSPDLLMWLVKLARRTMLWSTATAVSSIQSAAPVLPQSWNEWAIAHQTASEQAKRMALTEDWMEALLDVHGHQIFQLGLFNADPHPGNILILEEPDGSIPTRLGLIDFGQCKRLSIEERSKVAQLVLDVANNESDEIIASSFRNLGVVTKNGSTEFLAEFSRLMFGRLESRHLSHAWHMKLHKMDKIDYFPNELSMVYRNALLLRGLAVSLQVNVSVADLWRQHAQVAVDEHAKVKANLDAKSSTATKSHRTQVKVVPTTTESEPELGLR